MEKFYIVPDDTKLYKDFTAYEASKKAVKEVALDFMSAHGIESEQCVPLQNYFGVPADWNGVGEFSAQLCKKEEHGFRFFKKNSPVGKDWTARVNGIEVLKKPFLPFYFRGIQGRMSTRLFRLNGIVYCSMDSEAEGFQPLEGLTELKASTFWMIVEEYERKERETP